MQVFVCGETVYQNPVVSWRAEDMVVVEYSVGPECVSGYVYANSYTSKVQAMLDILRTTFIVGSM